MRRAVQAASWTQLVVGVRLMRRIMFGQARLYFIENSRACLTQSGRVAVAARPLARV
jgi:hypothetical protein